MICCMLLLLVNPFCFLPNGAGSDAGSSFRFIPRLFISQLSAFSFIFMAPPKLLLVTPMLRLCVALLFPNMFPTVKVFAVAPLVYWIRLSAKLTAATLCRTINLPTIGISTDNCSPFFARPLKYLITRSQLSRQNSLLSLQRMLISAKLAFTWGITPLTPLSSSGLKVSYWLYKPDFKFAPNSLATIKTGSRIYLSRFWGFVVPERHTSAAENVKTPKPGTTTPFPFISCLAM